MHIEDSMSLDVIHAPTVRIVEVTIDGHINQHIGGAILAAAANGELPDGYAIDYDIQPSWSKGGQWSWMIRSHQDYRFVSNYPLINYRYLNDAAVVMCVIDLMSHGEIIGASVVFFHHNYLHHH
jgi:hypothetical protein